MASKLCGTAAYREHGQDHLTRHPVMSEDMIRQLPAGHALVIRGGLSPVVARLPMVWKDRAYKRARRRGYATAAITAAPQAVIAPAPRRTRVAGTDTPALPHPAAADAQTGDCFAWREAVPAGQDGGGHG